MNKPQILKLEDIIKISSRINEHISNEYDTSNMEVVFKTDNETVNKINESIFYSNFYNPSEKPEIVDEVVINVNNIHFKYVTNKEG